MHDEDDGVIRAAANVIAGLFGGHVSHGDPIAMLSLRSDSPTQRASCLECISKGWPNHPLLATIIDQARQSVSNELRIASIAAKVHLNNQQDTDLTELLTLARDRWNSSTAYSWRPEIANTLAQGWPQSSRLQGECIASAQPTHSGSGFATRVFSRKTRMAS